MTRLMFPIMEQAKYVCAVHRFIQDLLLKTVPGLLEGSLAFKTNQAFSKQIETAIAAAATPTSTERDFIRAIVEAASAEMKPLCHLLRGASEVVGLGKVADRYLDGTRFREMLLRKDEDKLERLNAIVRTAGGTAAPVKILMDVAAELDGRAESYDGMDAAAKRKAARDMTKLIGKVEEMRTAMGSLEHRIDEGKDEIVSRVDEVSAKIDKIKIGGKRKSKHTAEQKKVCLACWMSAQKNAELKSATRVGRATYASAFQGYKRQLALVGVTTLEKFMAVMHTMNNATSAANIKKLEAQREAARLRKKESSVGQARKAKKKSLPK